MSLRTIIFNLGFIFVSILPETLETTTIQHCSGVFFSVEGMSHFFFFLRLYTRYSTSSSFPVDFIQAAFTLFSDTHSIARFIISMWCVCLHLYWLIKLAYHATRHTLHFWSIFISISTHLFYSMCACVIVCSHNKNRDYYRYYYAMHRP